MEIKGRKPGTESDLFPALQEPTSQQDGAFGGGSVVCVSQDLSVLFSGTVGKTL